MCIRDSSNRTRIEELKSELAEWQQKQKEYADAKQDVYKRQGEYSAVLKIENPVQKYSADIDSYYDFTHLFSALAQTLGEGDVYKRQCKMCKKTI